MNPRLRLAIAAFALSLGGCATVPSADDAADAAPTLDRAVARAVAEFAAPAWDVELTTVEPDRLRVELRSRLFFAGGDGEARQIFMNAVRRAAADGGYAGYDVLGYQEGIEGNRPLARRVAVGEFRLVRSRIWPEL